MRWGITCCIYVGIAELGLMANRKLANSQFSTLKGRSVTVELEYAYKIRESGYLTTSRILAYFYKRHEESVSCFKQSTSTLCNKHVGIFTTTRHKNQRPRLQAIFFGNLCGNFYPRQSIQGNFYKASSTRHFCVCEHIYHITCYQQMWTRESREV